MRPLFGSLDEPGPHGILENVAKLRTERFLATQPMLEEIGLPDHSEIRSSPVFPVPDGFCQRSIWRESEQTMAVIGHHEENVRIPIVLLVIEFDRLKNSPWCFTRNQLVDASLLAADRQEPNLLCWIDPIRNVVRQQLASSHRVKVGKPLRGFPLLFFGIAHSLKLDGTRGAASLPLRIASRPSTDLLMNYPK